MHRHKDPEPNMCLLVNSLSNKQLEDRIVRIVIVISKVRENYGSNLSSEAFSLNLVALLEIVRTYFAVCSVPT